MYTKHAYALNFKAAFETLLQEESKHEKMFKISDVNSIPSKAETNELFFQETYGTLRFGTLKLTFPVIESVLLNCLPRPRICVLHLLQVISRFENTWDLIEMNLRKHNCLYSLHANGIVSLDLDFKMQFVYWRFCQNQNMWHTAITFQNKVGTMIWRGGMIKFEWNWKWLCTLNKV